jgi:hypothetical protein
MFACVTLPDNVHMVVMPNAPPGTDGLNWIRQLPVLFIAFGSEYTS